MAFTHIDLIGLNQYEMLDAPIVADQAELIGLAESSKKDGHAMAVAGMRHSQGGHTALDDSKHGRMVFTEAMAPSIQVAANRKIVKVNAGATWSDLHFELGPLGLAPLVHQSSPHFSIGGSLSVDCHGREVREGALSNTVESITVLTHKVGVLTSTTASRKTNPDLFFAALGGYGACGLIMDATLRVTDNIMLTKFGYRTKSLSDLNNYLKRASKGKSKDSDQDIHMFYAWMNVSTDQNAHLTEAMVYEYIEIPMPNHSMRSNYFKDEKWATTEAMRAAWVAGRRDKMLRGKLFEEISKMTKGNPDAGGSYLINFLREEISFTGTKGDANDVDLLQEFFIPLPKIDEFLKQLKILLPANDPQIEVLSCTLRVIQPPKAEYGQPLLSYAYRGQNHPKTTPMVSIALEIKVPKERQVSPITFYPKFVVSNDAATVIQKIINLALQLEGSYYLPYYQVATLEQFKAAYPNHSEWKKQADVWNPVAKHGEARGQRLFNNQFLEIYLNKL